MSRWLHRLLIALAGVLCLAGPASAARLVPDGGVVIGGGDPARVTAMLDRAQAAGLAWIRLDAPWQALQPSPGSLDQAGSPAAGAWADLLTTLREAKARGLSVALGTSNAPQWASGKSASNDPPTPDNLPSFAAFMNYLAQKAGPYVDAYFPWNEPNIGLSWDTYDPVAYTRLQQAAYPALKAGDPTAIVSSAPIGPTPGAFNFVRQIYAAGIRGSIDVLSYNLYPPGAPEDGLPNASGQASPLTLPGQGVLRGILDSLDPGRPVWLTELSWSTCSQNLSDIEICVPEATQADYLVRAFTYLRRYLSPGVQRIFWYRMDDQAASRASWFYNQGLLHFDLTPKPAYTALDQVAVTVPDGTPGAGPGTAAGGGAPVSPSIAGSALLRLPAKAARPPAPASARVGKRGRITLGRPKVTVRRGIITLTMRVRLIRTRATLRVEGYRPKRWRRVATVTLKRSSVVRVRVRDRGYLGLRVKAKPPKGKRWVASRVVRVPAPKSARELRRRSPAPGAGARSGSSRRGPAR
jgi:polysaccharide biosynthesis protein PslG